MSKPHIYVIFSKHFRNSANWIPEDRKARAQIIEYTAELRNRKTDMGGEKDSGKISDNPRSIDMKALLPGLEIMGKGANFLGKLGIKREQMQRFASQIEDLLQQSKLLDLPDRFNAAFGSLGYQLMSSTKLYLSMRREKWMRRKPHSLIGSRKIILSCLRSCGHAGSITQVFVMINSRKPSSYILRNATWLLCRSS
jgi:hypothetical protein